MTAEPAPDLLTAARERARANRFWCHLGVEVDEAAPGRVRLRVPVGDDLRNAPGTPVHGGVYAALVDMAVGAALGTTLETSAGGVNQTTLDLNVSFLAAASGDTLYAEGTILRRGRSVAFGETRLTDASGRLVAIGRATYMILAGRP